LASPFKAVELLNVAIRLLAPFATADTAPLVPVRFEPSPTNEVAVNAPVSVAPVLVVSNFKPLL
jgi:hypothetical protein